MKNKRYLKMKKDSKRNIRRLKKQSRYNKVDFLEHNNSLMILKLLKVLDRIKRF